MKKDCLSAELLIGLLFLLGCTGSKYLSPLINTTDNNSVKGYIQIYNGPKLLSPTLRRSTSNGFFDTLEKCTVANVVEVIDSTYKFVGEVQRYCTPIAEIKSAFLRIIASPGAHHYVLLVGDNDNIKDGINFTINVEQNRVIPVRLDIYQTEERQSGNLIIIRGGCNTVICQSIPFSNDSLMQALENNNWETRWLAAFMLAELKVKEAENKLRNIMQNDSDYDVRESAKWALENILGKKITMK